MSLDLVVLISEMLEKVALFCLLFLKNPEPLVDEETAVLFAKFLPTEEYRSLVYLFSINIYCSWSYRC